MSNANMCTARRGSINTSRTPHCQENKHGSATLSSTSMHAYACLRCKRQVERPQELQVAQRPHFA
eukprot:5679267-Amphidinium_carterae.1